MDHLCATCNFCHTNNACVDCALNYFHEYAETKTSLDRTSAEIIKGEAYYLDNKFEIERVSDYVIKISHPYFNCSEVNLVPLMFLTYAGDQKTIGIDPGIHFTVKGLVTDLLCNPGSTPNTLIGVFNTENIEINVFDARKGHHLEFEELFRIFSNKEFFIADIHDLTHHGTQTLEWEEFVSAMGAFGLETNKGTNLERHELAIFLLYTCLEYAIFDSVAGPYSAGCLNWQSPRKSPAEMIQYYGICGACINRWNCIRALRSLYRRQEEISKKLNKKIDWLSQLGYKLPKTFINNLDKEIDYLAPLKYKFKAPKSPKLMFNEARRLMETVDV